MNWQQKVSKYNMILLYPHAKTHFTGIADHMSQLLTTLMRQVAIKFGIRTDAVCDWKKGKEKEDSLAKRESRPRVER
jgi:hypothetical protein